MPTWLQIILAIIGALGTIGGILGFSAYFSEKAKIKARADVEREELRKAEEEKIQHEHNMNEIRSILKEEIKPVQEDISKINNKLEMVENGALSTLRNDILTCYYKCVEKGYRNDYDLQNMDHMYAAYKDLHGNSYVADIYDRFKKLPVKEQVKEISIDKPKTTKTKKELVTAD